jgi:hypothetical protein
VANPAGLGRSAAVKENEMSAKEKHPPFLALQLVLNAGGCTGIFRCAWFGVAEAYGRITNGR